MSYLLLSTISGQKIGALSYTDGDSIPDHFANGLPFETNGSLAVDVDGVISHYHQGLPFSADGRLVGTLSETPTRFGGGAAPFSAEGRLVLGSSGVTHYSGGVGYTEAGSIGAVASAPPTCWPEPIGPCSTAMQRYLWEMDGQSMYWRRESRDYGQSAYIRYKVAFVGGAGTGLVYLVGQSGGYEKLYLATNGTALVVGNGQYGSSNNAATVDISKINTLELIADGTDVVVTLNGVEVFNKAQGFGGLLDNLYIGTQLGQYNFYDGSIYAVEIETDNENDVYPLDGNGPYELPNGVEIGPELVTTNASYDWVSGGSYGVVGLGLTADSAKTYYIELDLRGGTEAGSQMKINGVAGDGPFMAKGILHKFTLSGLDGNITLQTGSTPYRGETIVTIKELPSSALIRENEELDGSDIILIDRQADNGGWDTVANAWEPAVKAITGSATSSSPTSITIDEVGNNTPLAGVQIFSSGLAGYAIRVTGNATINSGQVDISLLSGLAGVAASITASGPFSFDLDSTGYVGFKRAFAGGADATITNLKVITVLDYAAGAV